MKYLKKQDGFMGFEVVLYFWFLVPLFGPFCDFDYPGVCHVFKTTELFLGTFGNYARYLAEEEGADL